MERIVPPARQADLGWRLALALLLAWLAACTTPAPPDVPSSELRAQLASAAITAATEPPAIRFEGFAHGKLEGAGIGASRTFVSCIGALGHGSCQGSICGAALLLGLGLCTVATPVGGVVGAVIAPSAEQVRAAEAELRGVLGRNPLHESLRGELIAAARSHPGAWSPASGAAPETRIEVALTRVETEGAGIDSPLRLSMAASARVLGAGDSALLWEGGFVHRGGEHKLAEWSAEHGAPLLSALEQGYRALGAEIFERLFTLYPFPDARVQRRDLFHSSFGLAPLEEAAPDAGSARSQGRRPLLRWQAFPRASDRAAAPAEMERVTRVRYELRVTRDTPAGQARLIYTRSNLERPEHRLEQSLAPRTVYTWSVRAHFELDGRPQHTEWSGFDRDHGYVYRTP
jgi:hypothetical protein